MHKREGQFIDQLESYIELNDLNNSLLKMVEHLSDPAIVLYFDDIDDFNTLQLIAKNRAADQYYRKNNLDVTTGTNVQEAEPIDIREIESFRAIHKSIKNQTYSVYKNHYSKMTNNYITLESHPITSKAAIVIFKNITKELKRIEKLRNTQLLYETIFFNSPLGIIGLIEGEIAFINPKFSNITGYSEEELLGNQFEEYLLGDDETESITQTKFEQFDITELDKYRKIIVSKSGKRIPVQLFSSMIQIENNNLKFVFIQDLTIEENLQNMLRFRQQLDMINIFASGIAHDFNNLLTVIVVNLELLRSMIVEDDKYKLVQHSLTAAQNASKIVQKLKRLTKEQERGYEKFDIYDVVSEVFDLILIPDNVDLGLNIDFEPGEYQFYGDPTDFHQILMNLTLNSIQIMLETEEENHIEVSCRKEGNNLIMKHMDTGPGVDEEFSDLIFQPFVSGNKKIELSENMGMGLTVVNQIISEKYNGKIWVDKEYSDGAKFVISLPLV